MAMRSGCRHAVRVVDTEDRTPNDLSRLRCAGKGSLVMKICPRGYSEASGHRMTTERNTTSIGRTKKVCLNISPEQVARIISTPSQEKEMTAA
jgi:hypothetical protein